MKDDDDKSRHRNIHVYVWGLCQYTFHIFLGNTKYELTFEIVCFVVSMGIVYNIVRIAFQPLIHQYLAHKHHLRLQHKGLVMVLVLMFPKTMIQRNGTLSIQSVQIETRHCLCCCSIHTTMYVAYITYLPLHVRTETNIFS